jgi:HK97 family phage major capsid protein
MKQSLAEQLHEEYKKAFHAIQHEYGELHSAHKCGSMSKEAMDAGIKLLNDKMEEAESIRERAVLLKASEDGMKRMEFELTASAKELTEEAIETHPFGVQAAHSGNVVTADGSHAVINMHGGHNAQIPEQHRSALSMMEPEEVRGYIAACGGSLNTPPVLFTPFEHQIATRYAFTAHATKDNGLAPLNDAELAFASGKAPLDIGGGVMIKCSSPFIDFQGGQLVGVQVWPQILYRLRDMLWIRKLGTVIPTTEARLVMITASLDVAMEKVAEGSVVPGGVKRQTIGEFLGKVEFTPHHKQTTVKIPEELLTLWRGPFDLLGFVFDNAAATAKEEDEGTFVTGTGNGEALGVLKTQSINQFPHGGSGGLGLFGPEDINAMQYRLPQKYRNMSDVAIITSGAALIHVSNFRTDSGGAGTGNFLLQPGLSAGDPSQFVGIPVIEAANYPDGFTSGAPGDPIMTVGAWKQYHIVERTDFPIRVLDQVFAEDGQIGYLLKRALDASPVLLDAFAHMVRTAAP